MDRNQAIGLTLIGLVMIVYFTFFAQPPVEPQPQSKAKTEQAAGKTITTSPADSTVKVDTGSLARIFGPWANVATGAEQTFSLANKDLKLTFNSKGAALEAAELVDYKTWDGNPLSLFTKSTKQQALDLVNGTDNVHAADLYYVGQQNGNSLSFTATNTLGQSITQTYELPAEGYQLKWTLKTNGISVKEAALSWNQEALRFERDLKAQRITTTVNWFNEEDGFNSLGETSLDAEEKTGQTAKWIAVKQKFFITSLLAPSGLKSFKVNSVTNAADSAHIKSLKVAATIAGDQLTKGVELSWYLGPNKFSELKQVAIVDDFDKNLYLGWPVINLINRFLTVNIFGWLEHITSNYGIIIIILSLMVRLLLLPLGYRSYIGMAKMRVMKPELDAIKAKVGDDLQAQQAEQMKLYQQVGINPLSGCLPLLLQMPVLFAMFNFFPNSIELRQQTFLWAQDLSTYDDLISWSISVPFLGTHLSVFNVLLMFSTLGITYFNNQQATVNEQMKYIGYIMPVVLMFVLNDLPAGLNFYYICSNVLSISQQIIIRRFVDEDALHKQLQDNKVKNANKPKTGFMARLEEMSRQAEVLRQEQDKKKGKK